MAAVCRWGPEPSALLSRDLRENATKNSCFYPAPGTHGITAVWQGDGPDKGGAVAAAETTQSHGERRRERYREIASILWDERVLFLFKDTGVGEYAPSGASLDGDPRRRPRARGSPGAARGPRAACHSSAWGRRSSRWASSWRRARTWSRRPSPPSSRSSRTTSPPCRSNRCVRSSRPNWKVTSRSSTRSSRPCPWRRPRSARSIAPGSTTGATWPSRCSGRAPPRSWRSTSRSSRAGRSRRPNTRSGVVPTTSPALATEFVTTLRSELDYQNEARNLTRFREAFADDPSVAFPEPIAELTTARVLTMELIEGVPGTRPDLMDEAGIDRREVVEAGVRCYLRQIFELGYFHADPHEGNLFAMPDGRVGFIDFGRVGWVSERNRARVFDLMLAFVEGDDAAATDVLVSMISAGPRLRRHDPAARGGTPRRRLPGARHGPRPAGGLHAPPRRSFASRACTCRPSTSCCSPRWPCWRASPSTWPPTTGSRTPWRPTLARSCPSRLDPEQLKKAALRTLTRYTHLFDDLPVGISRALRRASEGEFRVAVRPSDYDRLMDRLSDLVVRLSLTLLLAAFVVGFSIIVALQPGNRARSTSWPRSCSSSRPSSPCGG